ncbi:HSF5 protein, partial [Todus mexicanus]|nr:HSF5 protein [Todus mexicanus]
PDSLNPEAFPAKLWLLVNSPRFGSIRWDARGQGLLIDEQPFVSEVLGMGPAGDGGAGGLFKTKSFTSIIRQLNLYGFRKVVKELVVVPRSSAGPGPYGDGSPTWYLHHYYSPHFCRGRPDLLVHLKRLTSAKKAKLVANLELTSRPSGCSQQ